MAEWQNDWKHLFECSAYFLELSRTVIIVPIRASIAGAVSLNVFLDRKCYDRLTNFSGTELTAFYAKADSFVLPILTYCSQAWLPNRTNIFKIERSWPLNGF